MRRSAKQRKVGFWPWVIGVIAVGALLVALFSLTATQRVALDWPLGIEAREVRAYAAVFDRRPVEVGSTEAQIIRFGGSQGADVCIDEQQGGGWRTRWFETDGYGDSVEVRRLRDRSGYLVRFKKEAPLGGQQHMLLLPANVLDIRAEYLGSVATQLGLLTPRISYVRVIGCGRELGVHRRMERVDERFLERLGLRNASLVEIGMDPDRPDAQFARIKGDSVERAFLRGTLERALLEAQQGNTDALAGLVDQKAAIGWLLMAWIDGRDLRQPLRLAHQWNNGRMVMIYEVADANITSQGSPVALDPILPLLDRPDFQARFEARVAELQKEIPALRERFDGLRKAWLPVLSDERTMPFAQSIATRQGEDILARIGTKPSLEGMKRELFFGPGHATFLAGMSMPASTHTSDADPLVDLVERYKLEVQGDTVFFPRGKYMINRDITFPAGTSVVLLQGARLFMAPAVNIRCSADLHVRGTLRNPVFIRPRSEASPFGTIAVLGSGSQHCSIRGLYISGGSGALLEGIRHDAMCSIQGTLKTEVSNSVFEEHRADAALAIHGGEVELEGLRCDDARRTMIQLSYTNGQVRDSRFIGSSMKGSGLRIEAGRMAVVNCEFKLLVGAGVDAEAASQLLVKGSSFTECAVAISATDGSIVHVDGSSFTRNALVLEGSGVAVDRGAYYMLYTNEFVENAMDRRLDASSTIEMKGILDAGTLRSFGVREEEVESPRRGRSRR